MNPADNSFGIVKESTIGVTPATPAIIDLPHTSGVSITLNNEVISSTTVIKGRGAGPIRKTGFNSSVSFKSRLKRDPALDGLFENGLSGVFTAGVLKLGDTDISHTIEKIMKEGATTLYRRALGQRVSKVVISGEAAAGVDASFETVGLDAPTDTVMITGATYSAPTTTSELTGDEVTFSITGLTGIQYRSFELSIEQSREPAFALNSPDAFEVGTNGPAKVTLSATFYRKDWVPETLLIPDTPVVVTITIGSGANGYIFTIPAAQSSIRPKDEEDGAHNMVSVEFTAMTDATEATQLKIAHTV